MQTLKRNPVNANGWSTDSHGENGDRSHWIELWWSESMPVCLQIKFRLPPKMDWRHWYRPSNCSLYLILTTRMSPIFREGGLFNYCIAFAHYNLLTISAKHSIDEFWVRSWRGFKSKRQLWTETPLFAAFCSRFAPSRLRRSLNK